MGAAQEAVSAVRTQLQAFQQHLPLLAALRNPGLRERHWGKISGAVGFTVQVDAGALGLGQGCRGGRWRVAWWSCVGAL